MDAPNAAGSVPTYRILVVDDDQVDRMRVDRMLREAPHQGWVAEIEVAATKAAGKAALRNGTFECVLLDLRLPDGDGLELLVEIEATLGEMPPVVMMTTLNDEKTALHSLSLGAQDYLIKGEFTGPMLFRSIRYAIQRDRLIKDRNRLTRELTDALGSIRTLKGLLPICCGCKKIRDDKGYWSEVEVYVTKHTDVSFSHGFCPDCAARWEAESNSWFEKTRPTKPSS